MKAPKILTMMVVGLLAAPLFLQGATTPLEAGKPLAEQVRHELAMLPYYGVFDNLEFKVQGNTVTLLGEVTQPVLKSDAGNVVRQIPGVENVKNEITVLPLSPFDNSIRLRTYRAIYSQPALSRYALGVIPSIHIIVDNGDVTLVGVVNSQADKNIATLQANSVPGVFTVKNDLRVATS